MADAQRTKLIDKIVKLFKLGAKEANTTEAEMMLAVGKARELMAQHAISMAEIEAAKGQDIKSRIEARIRTYPAYTRAGHELAEYDHAVAQAVAVLTDTRCYLSRSVGATKKASLGTLISMVFVGDEEDVVLAGELFIIWLKDVRRLTRLVYGGGNTWKKQHTSYAVGMGVRLIKRAEETVASLKPAEQETFALVVATKKDAVSRWMQQNLNIAPAPERKRKHDQDAFARGYRDGANFRMGTKNIR